MQNDPLIGRRLANFEVESVLGRGGMGQVYYGRDVKLRRPVAIKVIDARYRSDPGYAQRFVREAQTIATWRHENIVQIFYADDQDDFYYFVMEYIDGVDLARLLAEHKAEDTLLPHHEVLRICGAIAEALDYAHAKGVIHRDVKPSNVLVARDGRVVLTDFGLALDAEQGSKGEVFGSAHYIAPEQARNSSNAVPQSDLYSLGIILYEMLTGKVPFDDPSSATVAVQHITTPVPQPRKINPNLSAGVEAMLLKALSKLPQDRYQSGRQFMASVQDAMKPDESTVASPLLPTLPERKPVSTGRPLFYIGLGVGVALLVLIAFFSLGSFFGSTHGDDTPAENSTTESNVIAGAMEYVSPTASPRGVGEDDASTATVTPVISTTVPSTQNEQEAVTVQPSPTSSPQVEPAPTLLSDSRKDFSSEANGIWRYIWREPGTDSWQPLIHEERVYGTCWYAQDYIRICPESGHPGNNADIGWYWTSDVSGPLEIWINARKLDIGGDGVTIAVYNNTLSIDDADPIYQRTLAGNDGQGLSERVQIRSIEPGQFLFIVLRHNGDATSDHTAIRTRICHVYCP